MITVLLSMIPTLGQFITVLVVLFLSIWFTPIFQMMILRFESFMLYPFICAKCTNFWLNLIINIILAYVWCVWFLLWGIITSTVLAIMYTYTAKHS